MKTLKFHGYSDDTFGEYGVTNDDYDNCASGAPIEYCVSNGEGGLIVTGQHCPGSSGSWMVGVANYDPEYKDRPMPRWPMRIESEDVGQRGFNPCLIIEAPDDVVISCLNRKED